MTKKYYPMLLEAYKKDTIWGGHRLKSAYGKATDSDCLGETWELSVRENERCVIKNGEYAGQTLSDILGDEAADFPLLVKFLDAADDLSVQVHPIKNEMWYIVEADEGSELVYGLADKFDRAGLIEAAENRTIGELLTRVKVKPGEVYFIPQGLVHAIGKGILIAEIQENSDVTYRVYDYDRIQKDGRPRELHIEEAADSIRDYTADEITALRYEVSEPNDGLLCASKSFTARIIECKSSLKLERRRFFSHYLCISGNGKIGDTKIKKGDSLFLHEKCEIRTLTTTGGITLIESYPN